LKKSKGIENFLETWHSQICVIWFEKLGDIMAVYRKLTNDV
jgi:hypothetical protein